MDLPDIPIDANELFFIKLIDTLVKETNRYAKLYLNLHKEDLKLNSNFLAWPKDVIDIDKMLLFSALTYFMGIVKLDQLRSYWSTHGVLSLPFPKDLMSRCDFNIILSFLHCVDTAE